MIKRNGACTIVASYGPLLLEQPFPENVTVTFAGEELGMSVFYIVNTRLEITPLAPGLKHAGIPGFHQLLIREEGAGQYWEGEVFQPIWNIGHGNGYSMLAKSETHDETCTAPVLLDLYMTGTGPRPGDVRALLKARDMVTFLMKELMVFKDWVAFSHAALRMKREWDAHEERKSKS